MSCRSCMSAPFSAAAVAGQAPAACAGALGRTRLELALKRLDEPRVGGDPCGGGGRLVADEDELRVAAGEPHLDPSVVELAVQLERRLAERLEQAPADRGLEGDREKLGGAGGRLVADRRDAREVFAERLDVSVDLHDRSMTSR